MGSKNNLSLSIDCCSYFFQNKVQWTRSRRTGLRHSITDITFSQFAAKRTTTFLMQTPEGIHFEYKILHVTDASMAKLW